MKYIIYGNRGACHANEAHIYESGRGCLCGTPALSHNYVAEFGIKSPGCAKCIAIYNDLNNNQNMETKKQARPLYEIAAEIKNDWKHISYGAQPYLEAMTRLKDINDTYVFDSAKSIVLYFLANASSWKGEKARAIKAELKAITK